jgi:hypothetical protein
VPEAFGQVAPGDAGLGHVQNRIDEASIVLGEPTSLSGPARQQVLDTVPIGIRNRVPL